MKRFRVIKIKDVDISVIEVRPGNKRRSGIYYYHQVIGFSEKVPVMRVVQNLTEGSIFSEKDIRSTIKMLRSKERYRYEVIN